MQYLRTSLVDNMDMILEKKVITIARNARAWAEQKAHELNQAYNVPALSCWCAIASGKLHTDLIAADIPAVIGLSESEGAHAYVVVDDHVVDITATQFGIKEKVFVRHLKEADRYWWYKEPMFFNSSSDLRKYQQHRRWPRSQIAYKNY